MRLFPAFQSLDITNGVQHRELGFSLWKDALRELLVPESEWGPWIEAFYE